MTINKTLGIEQLKLDAHGPHRSLEQNQPLKNQIYGLIYIISRETQGVIEQIMYNKIYIDVYMEKYFSRDIHM